MFFIDKIKYPKDITVINIPTPKITFISEPIDLQSLDDDIINELITIIPTPSRNVKIMYMYKLNTVSDFPQFEIHIKNKFQTR